MTVAESKVCGNCKHFRVIADDTHRCLRFPPNHQGNYAKVNHGTPACGEFHYVHDGMNEVTHHDELNDP